MQEDAVPENNEPVPDPLRKTQESLYSREYKAPEVQHTELKLPHLEVNQEWQHAEKKSVPDESKIIPKQKTSAVDPLFKKIFIIAVIFFILSAAVVFSIFYFGFNVVSTSKVDVTFQGPVSIGAGNELDFNVTIANNNGSELLNPILYVDYPDGTKETTDLSADLLHEKDALSNIAAGSSRVQAEKAVLFGEQGTTETINVTLDYGLKGSDTTFTKTAAYNVAISSSPISMIIDYPQQVTDNSNVAFNVTVNSNSTQPISNLLLEADYPFGFQYASSTPAPAYGSNLWQIPSLAPGGTKTFTISGTLQGKQGDQPNFRFLIGPVSTSSQQVIATNYLNIIKQVNVAEPPIGVDVTLGGNDTDAVAADLGSVINGTITVTNNLAVQIVAGQIQAAFSGPLLDPLSPKSENGFYQSANSSIVWDKSTLQDLQYINPGQSITVDFSVASLQPSQIKAFENGTISVAVTASGQQTDATGASESVTNSVQKTIKIQSGVGIASRGVYSIGPFKNSGPIPPQPNVPTTYTIIWDVTTSSNSVADTSVTATLPQYVTWLGVISPSSENVTYDPIRNQITWHIGALPAYTGGSSPAREMAFQVKMLPSTSQSNTVPVIVNQATVQAVNTFTNNTITNSAPGVTTSLDTDPGVPGNSGVVAQ